MAATFVDVPPISTTTPSAIWVNRSTPATEAAGPEYSVRAGSRRKPAMSVAPPSPRITMTGLSTPAAATPASTKPAVRDGDREDRRVDRRGHGAQLEAVEAGHLARRAGGQPRRAQRRDGDRLVAVALDRERLGDARRGRAGLPQPPDRGGELAGVEAVGDVEELVHGRQPATGRQVDAVQERPLARLAQVRPAAEPEHADEPDVALEQRVDRLRRRVRRPARPARRRSPRPRATPRARRRRRRPADRRASSGAPRGR